MSPLAALDLNLLLLLHVLLEEGSVTAAAARVGVTQSAASRSLARLRAVLGDELFVRTARGMQPTVRAEAMRRPLADIIASIDALVHAPPTFDPAVDPYTFRIATADYGYAVAVEPLFHRLEGLGARVDFDVRPLSDHEYRELAAGSIDALVGLASGQAAAVVWQDLFTDDFCCLVDAQRGPRRLTRKRYLAANHILVAPLGLPGGVVDDVLAAQGEARRVMLRMPTFLAVPSALQGTEAIVTLPRRIAEAFAARWSLRVLSLPIEVGTFTMQLGWHEIHRASPAHRWLREQLRAGRSG